MHDDARLQDWLDARVHAMYLARSWGFDTSVRDWPPIWRVPIELTPAEAAALRVLATMRAEGGAQGQQG